MAGPGPGNDDERLPWLEPYRDAPSAKPAAVPARKRGGGMVAGGVAALAAALTAGYYVGQRDRATEPVPQEIAIAPVSRVVPQAPVKPAAPIAPAPKAEAPPPVEARAAPVVTKVAVSKPKRSVRQRKIRSARNEAARRKAVRSAQLRKAPRRPAPRAWPKMPSPGPAGQVVQLGAFRNPARANRAYRTRIARYPALGRMPRVIVPVITKPRGEVLYVLRLGTTSRQQSRIVCRNLRTSGDHCIVIG